MEGSRPVCLSVCDILLPLPWRLSPPDMLPVTGVGASCEQGFGPVVVHAATPAALSTVPGMK